MERTNHALFIRNITAGDVSPGILKYFCDPSPILILPIIDLAQLKSLASLYPVLYLGESFPEKQSPASDHKKPGY